MDTAKELLNTYRRDNVLKTDKIVQLERQLKEMTGLVNECYLKIDRLSTEKEYYKWKVQKNSAWFWAPPEPEIAKNHTNTDA